MDASPVTEADTGVLNALVLRIARGDAKAFEAFYESTVQGVLRIATGVLRDRAQAQEVAQDVYLELWRSAPRLDPDRPVEHLLRQMARRRAIDRVRAVQASRERDHHCAARDHRPA
ncbi:sigma factor [Rathayibacter sp. VKM Ac-2927]|uniref:sigma factor n=1 Tax=Rathayibacter sp. VKM Ac-2927 TaxID=2929478 RepID=UPI0035ABDF96